MKRERLLGELYDDDPEAADHLVWGRRAGRVTRRGFLNGAGLTAMAVALGADVPFAARMPAGLVPVGLQETPFRLEGKDGLIVLNERPVGAETPAHLLDDDVTPTKYHFVRNNGLLSERAGRMDASGWTLTVDGEVERPLQLSLGDLRSKYQSHTLALQLECTGNGRSGYDPRPGGMLWTVGGVACAEWTGVRLRDVLADAGVRPTAVYTGHHCEDVHLSGDPGRAPLSRGVPLEKAQDPFTLIAWQLNGEPVPAIHGFPVRLVAPGWPGSASAKWLRRIEIRSSVHDGQGMTGYSYRVNRYPVAPGSDVPPEEMDIIEGMPVKSVITRPQTGTTGRAGAPLDVRGHAWAGDREVARVDLSIDFGATWTPAMLRPPVNRYAWQRWEAAVSFPVRGYYEIWARATDSEGVAQPFTVPGWNPRGYLNNTMHRIAVTLA